MFKDFLKALGKIIFTLLLLIFIVAFFLQKQYLLCFLTLAMLLVYSRWGQVKKLIISKGKVEVEIPKEVAGDWPKKDSPR